MAVPQRDSSYSVYFTYRIHIVYVDVGNSGDTNGSMEMTLDEYQVQAHKTSGNIMIGDGFLLYPALGMAGEVGEFINKVKKIYRDETIDEVALGHELGDILWYLAECSTQLGFDLDDIAQGNLNKLASRAEKGTIHGSGDNR